jgi:hypothetical protein
MVNSFASALGPPETDSRCQIRPVREVVEDHIRSTYEANKDGMTQYLIAFHLGISPTTLIRMKQRWRSEGP